MSVNVCPNCNSPITPGSAFCDNCGLNLVSAPPTPAQPASYAGSVATQYQASSQAMGAQCANCGAFNAPGAGFCENCGMQISAAAPAAPAPAPASGSGCASCGFVNVPGASFCEQCGNPVSSAAPPAYTPPPAYDQVPAYTPAPVPTPAPEPYLAPPVMPSPAPLGYIEGRLVIQASNASLPLMQGRSELTLGREDPVSNIFPDINLDPHGGHDSGVGRQHAKLVISAGQLCLVDLNSVNGSFVNRQKVIPGQPQPINDGDEIRLGRMVLIYHFN